MSTYDDASIVMIPSGYKTGTVFSQKPMDANGQLAFTRSNDTATRVGPDGLIEKVRTNRILHSNSFSNASWSNGGSGVVLTSGQEDPFGGTNGWRFLIASASGYLSQNSVLQTNVSMTVSVWVKSNTGVGQSFRMTANSGTQTSPFLSATTSWTRVTWSFVSSSNGNILFPFSSTSALDLLFYGFQVETGDIATDYIATTTAAVSVGPVANVPRLDYLNSSCPRLLLEPQRTNNAQFSEAFDNAWWTKSNATVTSTLGGPIDQSKYFTITCDGTTGRFKGVGRSFLNASANTYSLSVFAKAGTSSTFVVSSRNTLTFNDISASFNLANGTIISQNGGTASIVNYGDGWYRCTFVVVNAGTFTNEASIFFGHPHGAPNGATVLATGAMSEVGAYATSYIPTLGASVTRGADACSKTGISSLIGQTEGTVFLDLQISANAVRAFFSIDIGATTNYITVITIATSQVRVVVNQAGSATNVITSSALTLGRHKLAIAYKSGDYALYIDGVQAAVSTSTAYPVGTLSQFVLNNASYGQFGDGYNQALVFKTRLSNSELASLTTL